MTTSAVASAVGERPDRRRARSERDDQRRARRWAVATGVTAAALTAVVAAPGLDNEFFRDEAVTADVAGRSLSQVLDLVGTIDVGHTLLYALVSALPLDPTSVAQIRLVSLIPIMIAGALAAGWATFALGRAAGVLTALVWPLMPATVGAAVYGRDYGLATLFAVIASILLIRHLSAPEAPGRPLRPWWGYVAAIALMVWCNLFALLLLPAHALAVIAITRQWRGRTLSWLASAGAALLACLPLLLLVLRQPDPINWVAPPLLRDLIIIPNRIIGGSAYGTNEAPSGAAAFTVLILVLCIVAAARVLIPWLRHRGVADSTVVTAVVSASWLIVPVLCSALVSLERPVFVARYLWFVAPAAVLLLATLASAATPAAAPASGRRAASVPSSVRPWLWAVVVPVLVLLVGAGPRQGLLETEGGVDYRGTVAFLAEAASRGDVLVSDDPGYNFTRSGLESAAGGPLPVDDVLVARTGVERGDIPAEEFPEEDWEGLLADAERVWVIANPGDEPGPREALAIQGRERVEDLRFDGLILRLYQSPSD